jgi:3-hydroxybutyrate dehydrogenase
VLYARVLSPPASAASMGTSSGATARLVALVTGSSSVGIGRGIVDALARRNDAIVYLHGHEPQAFLEDVSLTLNQKLGFEHERRIYSVSGDVRIPSECKEMVESIQSQWGSLDVLCNNAGVQFVSPVEEFPEEQYDKVMDTIMKGTFLLTKYALPGMKERGFGRIINTGSMHATVASPYKSVYNAAKHAVLGFTKTVALETATAGNITVNAVSPGYVWTQLLENQVKSQARALGIREEDVAENVFLRDQPIKRFIEVEEVARVVSMLAEKENGGITGAEMRVDGGWTAR